MAGKKKPTIIMVKPEKVEVSQETIFRANKRMEWAIGFMIVRYHFVYQMLACMNKRCVPGMGTMGVAVRGGGQFELFFDPDFVLQLNDEGLTYVMYHEILHLALHHCTRRKFDLKLLGNIATDLAVNELIPTVAGSCMPPIIDGEISGMHVSEFKKKKEYADILEKQTSEWYYDYLMKKAKEQGGQGGGQGEGGDDKDGDGQGSSFDDHGEWKEDEVYHYINTV